MITVTEVRGAYPRERGWTESAHESFVHSAVSFHDDAAPDRAYLAYCEAVRLADVLRSYSVPTTVIVSITDRMGRQAEGQFA